MRVQFGVERVGELEVERKVDVQLGCGSFKRVSQVFFVSGGGRKRWRDPLISSSADGGMTTDSRSTDVVSITGPLSSARRIGTTHSFRRT
jgi:hypothetical protein